MNILLKTNYGRDRRPNYAIFLIWSASYASAETLRRGGSMSSYSFFEQLNDYYSHVFSLTPRVYESFFKKQGRGLTPKFHLVVFVFGAIQES